MGEWFSAELFAERTPINPGSSILKAARAPLHLTFLCVPTYFVSLCDVLTWMRASARTRVTFVSAKVTKTIRSDAQPFGFPNVLGQTGEAVNSLYSDIRPVVSCLPCAARLRVSRSWRTIHFFRRSPYRGRFFGERSRRLQMRVNSPGLSPF